MAGPVKQAFAHLSGLPPREDQELSDLMTVAARLPRHATDEIIFNLYRAALGYERTGDTTYLACLAQDALVTMRLRRDPDSDRALEEAPVKPASHADAVDVEQMLRERGL